jgi:Fungal Zn(2)-Cys(6) binuclear cluster domain
MESASNNNPPPRKRARIACHLCHERKVRCDTAIVGTPCTNCRMDNHFCSVRSTPVRSVCPSRSCLALIKHVPQLMSDFADAQRRESKIWDLSPSLFLRRPWLLPLQPTWTFSPPIPIPGMQTEKSMTIYPYLDRFQSISYLTTPLAMVLVKMPLSRLKDMSLHSDLRHSISRLP